MAMAKVTEHPDETVAATLGGLAKTLVIHGDVAGALAACAEPAHHRTTAPSQPGASCTANAPHVDTAGIGNDRGVQGNLPKGLAKKPVERKRRYTKQRKAKLT